MLNIFKNKEEEKLDHINKLLPDFFCFSHSVISKESLLLNGFLNYITISTINTFSEYTLKEKSFYCDIVHSSISIVEEEMENIQENKEPLELINDLIPYLFMNYKLFEKEDIFEKNNEIINFNIKYMPFLNKEGYFCDFPEFFQELKEIPEFLTLLKEILTIKEFELFVKNQQILFTKKEELKIIEEFKKNKHKSFIPINKAKVQLSKNRKYNGKKVSILDIKELKYIQDQRKTDPEALEDEVLEKKISIIEKNYHLSAPIPLATAKNNMLSELSELKCRFPNFNEVIDYISCSLNLSLLSGENSVLKFSPILLTGYGGIGKTQFCIELGKILNTKTEVWPMAQYNQGFTLSGLDLGWSSGKEGLVFKTLSKLNIANPFILLDEMDKTKSDGDILSVMYHLLEKKTAECFMDEALEFPINASYINWIGTVNDESELSIPLQGRFKIFKIASPEETKMNEVINSIYLNVIKNIQNGNYFEKNLEISIINKIKSKQSNPRKIRKIIEEAIYTTAAKKFKKSGSFNQNENLLKIDDMTIEKILKGNKK